jgi:hypothetical protein
MKTHITMFKYCDANGHIRCVIAGHFKAEFEQLGFVDHINKVKAPVKRRRKAKKDAE